MVKAGEIVPHCAAGQDTVQFAPPLPDTIAASCWICPAGTTAEVGETETKTAGTVMVAKAVFVGSVTEVAVSITFRSFGGSVSEVV